MVVNVIDSPCGSGKTTYAIRNILSDSSKRVLYITPYIKEAESISRSVGFNLPKPAKFGGKTASCLNLLVKGESICSTHALLIKGGDRFAKLVSSQGYILVLDEMLKVLDTINLSADDVEGMIIQELIEVNRENGMVSLGSKAKSGYVGDREWILSLVKKKQVMYSREKLLIWEFPPYILESFSEVWILSYLFEQQTMCNYLLANGIEVKFHYIEETSGNEKFSEKVFSLVEGKCGISGTQFSHLIDICDNCKLNSIGEAVGSLSYSWWTDAITPSGFDLLKVIKNNCYNYVRNIARAKSSSVLWTTFKDAQPFVEGKGYVNGFIQHNKRATNEYSDRDTLMYLINKFENPLLHNYFVSKGIAVKQDVFALSELIQWLFRSAIRRGKPIKLYIPSKRMRTLLTAWLDGTFEEKYNK